MSGPRFDVLGVGDCDVDIYVRVPRLPGHDEKIHGVPLGFFAGGVIGNFCCAAARLGRRTAILSVVGDDLFGAQTADSLAAFGVDRRGLLVRADRDTYFCVVHLDASGEKALTLARTSAIFPASGDLDAELIGSARLVHMAPFDISVSIEVATIAAAAGACVSVDLEPGSVSEGFAQVERLLRHTSVCVVNEFALADLFDSQDLRRSAEELRARGPSVVVVTRGARGASVVGDAGAVTVPGFRVDVVDTTGAGDAFNAAFLSAWMDGWPLDRAVRFGCAAGALATRSIGSRSSLPTHDETLALANACPDATPPTRSSDDR